MQFFADLNGHHTAQHVEHLVFVGVDVEVGPGRFGWQLDLHESHQAVGLGAGDADEGTPRFRRQVGMTLSRCKDERSAHFFSRGWLRPCGDDPILPLIASGR